jgi:PII-like signaling protein
LRVDWREPAAVFAGGVWGYHGDHFPHGDSLRQLRRHVPVLTVLVDTPERTARWFAIVDELTGDSGLVTREIVPSAV